jgi:hypothetical protein
MRSRFSLFIFAAALAALSFGTPDVRAQVTAAPNVINFQGRLAMPSGNPVADGTYSIRFRFYDAATAGNVLYEKTIAAVQVKNGTFAVTLDAIGSTAFNGNTWLGIQIGSDAELTPRTPIVSVPYALKSNLALTVPDNSITTANLQNNAVTNTKLATDGLSLHKVSGTVLSIHDGDLLFPNGVIKNTSTNISTLDLGLYSQVAGRWMRFVTNGAPFHWFADNNTGNVPLMSLTANGMMTLNSSNSFPALRVNSTSTGGTWLQLVNTTTNGRDWSLISTGSDNAEGAGKFMVRDQTSTDNRLVIDSGGNIGIGTNSPKQRLHVTGDYYGRGHLYLHAYEGDGSTGNAYIQARDDSATSNINLRFRTKQGTNLRENLILWNEGRMGVNGDGYNNATLGVVDSGLDLAIGTLGKIAGSQFLTVSDALLKHRIKTVPDALSTLLALRGVTYDWNPNVPNAIKGQNARQYGFLAQEVEQVLPTLVHPGLNGYKAVNYQGIIPVAVEAIKAQQSQIHALKRDNDVIRKENAAIREENAAIKATLDEVLRRLEAMEKR